MRPDGVAVKPGRVAVKPDDDAANLAARVLEREHQIYPQVIRWLAEGRLRLDGDRPVLDGRALDAPVIWDFSKERANA